MGAINGLFADEASAIGAEAPNLKPLSPKKRNMQSLKLQKNTNIIIVTELALPTNSRSTAVLY